MEMSQTLDDKSSAGTGREKVKSTSLRKHILIHKDTMKHANITVRSRAAFGAPAWPNSGGLLVLADPSCGLTELEAFTIQGCGYTKLSYGRPQNAPFWWGFT